MKPLLTIIVLTVSVTVFSQPASYSGTYSMRYDTSNAELEYTLNLNEDGTFKFHFYRNNDCSTCVVENSYGKGTWTTKKNLIYFSVDQNTDLDEEHTLNLNNSKARVDRKSPRNKSPEIVPDTLRFYESDIFWVSGMKLIKRSI